MSAPPIHYFRGCTPPPLPQKKNPKWNDMKFKVFSIMINKYPKTHLNCFSEYHCSKF